MLEFTCSVERVTYYNENNGYSVIKVRPEKHGGDKLPGLNLSGLLTVVGNLPKLSPGTHIRLRGDYETHAKHGLQFRANFCEQLSPATREGIVRYLGSGLIKGIGPELAKRIVNYFEENTLEVIENSPEQLKNVPGIGEDRTEKIINAWNEQKQIKEIMLFLHSYQVSTNLAVKIYKTYGDQSLDIVKNNPYQLEQDIYGIGFKTADKIAQSLGLPKEHPSRIETGIVYAINQIVNDGHVFATEKDLILQSTELLEVETSLVQEGLKRLANEKRVIRESIQTYDENSTSEPQVRDSHPSYEEPIVYLSSLFHSECGLARSINHLITTQKKANQSLLFDDPNLSEEQKQAIKMAVEKPVSVITGGPGTGKTTCLKALIQNLEANGVRYALVSPTGRAAKRLTEATLRPASTIHRLLAYNPMEGFKFSAKNLLKFDYIIIDESSMLDIILANHLLQAIKPGSQVLFVGDIDQLPSVGAGDVLRDIIASGEIPVTRLTKIYRQAENSEIILNAHRINQGKYPIFSENPKGDFFLFPADDAQQASEWVVDLVIHRIPENFGLNAFSDIQVLTPLYRGQAGVDNLNMLLQSSLNPPQNQKVEQKLFGRILREGDKVMQVQNNYDKEVFNGDIGIIEKINRIDQFVIVRMDEERLINYDFSETDELTLAYAVTVHKSQGSEFPAVVMPIITQHYIMLQRNLIYTAVTRAQKLCVLVGNTKAIRIGLANNQQKSRNSKLALRI